MFVDRLRRPSDDSSREIIQQNGFRWTTLRKSPIRSASTKFTHRTSDDVSIVAAASRPERVCLRPRRCAANQSSQFRSGTDVRNSVRLWPQMLYRVSRIDNVTQIIYKRRTSRNFASISSHPDATGGRRRARTALRPHLGEAVLPMISLGRTGEQHADEPAAARDTRPDKLMREAILRELHREAENAEGHPTENLDRIARRLVEKATDDDIQATEETETDSGRGAAGPDPIGAEASFATHLSEMQRHVAGRTQVRSHRHGGLADNIGIRTHTKADLQHDAGQFRVSDDTALSPTFAFGRDDARPLLDSFDLAQLRTIARAYGPRDRSGTFRHKVCHNSYLSDITRDSHVKVPHHPILLVRRCPLGALLDRRVSAPGSTCIPSAGVSRRYSIATISLRIRTG